MSSFGEYLVRERKKAGLSQAQLARSVGLSNAYISAIETGRKAAPPHGHVVAFAAYLGADERVLWQLAIEDREYRLREKLEGVPVSTRLGVGREGLDSLSLCRTTSLLGDPARVIEKIEKLLPTEADRKWFIRSLEVLAEILREAMWCKSD